MRIFRFLRPVSSAPVARERLQILLEYERNLVSQTDLIAVLRASNLGAPITICGQQTAPAHAYMDAARRLAGEDIELLIPTEKVGFFTKIFGRRAA